ncbi:MAG: pyridoxamine kinase [Candidatus Cloacimonetes bacterium]|nr:pyridoxamine kinase [Candidatus Cloacimonadota bacterium]
MPDKSQLTKSGNTRKTVLAIHDLSGYSHTSLMAVIPIMNTLQISVCALPTAILSTNTEQTGFRMLDCSAEMDGFLQHWKELNLSFSAIYSGFLGSDKQVELVIKAIEMFSKSKPLIVIDPVMADDGKLYDCFDKSIVNSMQKLISYADIITPNLTEAAFLLNEIYNPNISYKQVKDWCRMLSGYGAKQVVITSVPVYNDKTRTAVVCYDKNTETFSKTTCQYLPVNYPGSGDIFTSVLTCFLLKGQTLTESVRKATNFVCKAIGITMQHNTPQQEGIALEKVLHLLRKM